MSSVIVESRIRRADKVTQWVATEVEYEDETGGVSLSRPVVLSVSGPDKKRLEAVFWALMDARGNYFRQIMTEVDSRKKEVQ